MQIYEQKQRETTPPISLKKSHKDNNIFFFFIQLKLNECIKYFILL